MSWVFFEYEAGVIPAAIRNAQFGAAVPSGWDLKRSSIALGRSPDDGRWTSYPENIPRPEIDPLTLENAGLLIEPEATQLVLSSRFPNYVPSNATSTTDQTIQTPFGLGALKLTPNTATATHGWNFFFEAGRAVAVPDDTVISINAVLKPVGAYRRGRFALLGKDNIYRTVSFSLVGPGEITATSGAIASAAIKQDTDDFYSIRMSLNFGVGISAHACNLALALDNDERTFAGDGSSHVLVAYFGVEIGATVTSPILTSGTAASRAADILKADVTWAQNKGVSIGIDYTPLSQGEFTVLHMSSAAPSNGAIELFNRTAADLSTVLYRVTAIGGGSTNLVGVVPALGIGRTVVFGAAPDNFRIGVNGTQFGVDNSGGVAADMTALSIGSTGLSGIRPGAMAVRRIKLWSEPLDLSGVEAFSGNLSLDGQPADLPVLEMQQTRVVTPSETSVVLVLSLDRASQSTAVSYRTVDGTAKAGTDYVSASGKLYFETGKSTATLTIPMATRALSEDRSFTFELYSPVNCDLQNSVCLITLQRIIPEGTIATTRFEFDASALPPDWTLTRTTPANSRNASGLWVGTAAGLPRLHHHAPGISGLLLEPGAGEQRLFDSVDPGFGVVAATKTIVTTEQTATGMRYLRWRKDATVSDHKLTGTLTAQIADMPTGEFTLWFLARPVSHTRWKLRTKGIDNIWWETAVTLSGPGSVMATQVGVTTYVAQDPHFPDWYQIGLHRPQSPNLGVSAEFELLPVDDQGVSSIAGDDTQGIDICHVQLEPIAGMSSPIIVTAATAKTLRAADVLRATTAATWHKKAAYTIGLNFIRLRNQPTTQRLLMIKDQSIPVAPDDVGLVTAPASLRARVKAQNVNSPEIISPTPTVAGIADTAMLVVSATKVAMFHNGSKSGEAVLTTAPVVPGALRIGSSEPSGNDPMSLLLRQVYHWDHAISEKDAALFSGNLGFVPQAPAVKPIVSVPNSLNVREGSIIQVPVNKTGTAACQVNIRTRQNTALVVTPLVSGDYIGIGPVAVSFLAGETQKLVEIQTVADTVAEPLDPAENFSVVLELIAGNTSCELGNATCAISIHDTPCVQIAAAVNATEGESAVITITKTGFRACSVTYRTVGGTAVNGQDYTGIGATTLSFLDSETIKTVSIPILQDNTAETGQKFSVVLENPLDCTLGNATCTVTIFDVGGEPPPTGEIFERPVGFAQFVGTATTPTVTFGVGGDVYYVTTRADNPDDVKSGMLRHALRQNNKVVVFEVGGVFECGTSGTDPRPVAMRCDGFNLTIAGETAPYPGVIIQRAQLDFRSPFGRQTPNICLRHITVERGYDMSEPDNNAADALSIQAFRKTNPDGTLGGGPVTNIWIDHCAFMWASDECAEVFCHPGDPVMNNISITNCIFAESLFKPETETNPFTKTLFRGKMEPRTGSDPVLESEHNYGLIHNPRSRRVDYQYNLFTDMYFRVPVIAQNVSTVVANTVALNCRTGVTTGGGSTEDYEGPLLLTVEGYLGISGANTRAVYSPMMLTSRAQGGPDKGKAIGFRPPGQTPLASAGAYALGSKIWAKNLYGWKGAKSTYYQPLEVVVSQAGTTTLTDTEKKVIADATVPPLNLPTPVVALSADALYTRACQNVGPRPKERASHVKRIVDKLIAKDSTFVNHELKVGGYTNGTYWGEHGNQYMVGNTTRSLRSQTSTNPPKFKDGTVIPAFPSPATDKAKVTAWLERFLKEVQYD